MIEYAFYDGSTLLKAFTTPEDLIDFVVEYDEAAYYNKKELISQELFDLLTALYELCSASYNEVLVKDNIIMIADKLHTDPVIYRKIVSVLKEEAK